MTPPRTFLQSTRAITLLVAALAIGVVVLSGALAWAGLRGPVVVVVPGVRENQVLLPEEVPPAAALKFAHLYLTYFDDFTTETVEERSTFILRFLAPEVLEKVRRELQDRATYVIRTRESSQLVLVPPALGPAPSGVERLPGGLLRVRAEGVRRTYIASELKGSARIRYAVTLRPRLPTDHDAFGFEVVGQTIRPDETLNPESGKGVRHE